jgi:hypothetical protein
MTASGSERQNFLDALLCFAGVFKEDAVRFTYRKLSARKWMEYPTQELLFDDFAVRYQDAKTHIQTALHFVQFLDGSGFWRRNPNTCPVTIEMAGHRPERLDVGSAALAYLKVLIINTTDNGLTLAISLDQDTHIHPEVVAKYASQELSLRLFTKEAHDALARLPDANAVLRVFLGVMNAKFMQEP